MLRLTTLASSEVGERGQLLLHLFVHFKQLFGDLLDLFSDSVVLGLVLTCDALNVSNNLGDGGLLGLGSGDLASLDVDEGSVLVSVGGGVGSLDLGGLGVAVLSSLSHLLGHGLLEVCLALLGELTRFVAALHLFVVVSLSSGDGLVVLLLAVAAFESGESVGVGGLVLSGGSVGGLKLALELLLALSELMDGLLGLSLHTLLLLF